MRIQSRGETESIIHCGGVQSVIVALENSVFKKLKMKLPCHQAILLLGIYPREMKTYGHTKTCTKMFIAALVPIAKKWKQPKCQQMNG